MTELSHPGLVARRCPDKPAVVMAGSGAGLSFREFDELANRVSRMFRAAGLAPGDTVASLLPNDLHHLPIVTGARYAGLRYVPLSTRLGADEVGYILRDCGAALLLCSAEFAGLAARLLDDGPGQLRHFVCADGELPGYRPLAALLGPHPPVPLPERRMQGGAMLYSSGTTGRPKGVRFPVAVRPLGTSTAVAAFCRHYFGIDEQTVYLSPAPLYHAAPHGFCTAALDAGATVVLMERFDPEPFLAAIERHRVTHTQLVPTFFVRLLGLDEQRRGAHSLASLRVAVHAAAPCPVEVKRRMIDWWGPVLHEYYGGSERIGITYCNSAQWLAHPGTVGRPVLGELRICDDDGSELPPGRDGLVYFAGTVAFTYHNDDGKTRASRYPEHDTWATYGDIGHVDRDGYLYLTDRAAFTIISGGVNIYPQEAENVLAEHPKIADVAVFGIPDPEMGEQVKAVVQPTDWAEAGPGLAAELIEYCRARLAHYKCPRTLDFEPELPREPTGKLFKRLLRDRYR